MSIVLPKPKWALTPPKFRTRNNDDFLKLQLKVKPNSDSKTQVACNSPEKVGEKQNESKDSERRQEKKNNFEDGIGMLMADSHTMIIWVYKRVKCVLWTICIWAEIWKVDVWTMAQHWKKCQTSINKTIVFLFYLINNQIPIPLARSFSMNK